MISVIPEWRLGSFSPFEGFFEGFKFLCAGKRSFLPSRSKAGFWSHRRLMKIEIRAKRGQRRRGASDEERKKIIGSKSDLAIG
ncbi:MAG: hypothetical protein V8S08_05535 [Lachnoclostridium sp.]